MFDAKRNQLQDQAEIQESPEPAVKLKLSSDQRIAAANRYHGTEPSNLGAKSNTGMRIICTALIIVAGLQLLYFNSHSWSQVPWLQPAYLKVAQLLHPQRPIIESLGQLSLSIEPDGQFKNLLAINFSFTNNASFAQQLPDVKLTFSDLQGRLVARREFNAQQYLSHQQPPPGNIQPAQNKVS